MQREKRAVFWKLPCCLSSSFYLHDDTDYTYCVVLMALIVDYMNKTFK